MNVMVYNKYKELLMGLNIEVMKTLEGVYNVDEIIDTFANFYYDKMIIDITAIRDYQNADNLQKLAMNINMENVIILLDDSPETESKSYLSKLISLGIYNFTKNAEGINYLLVHPHTYRDVVNIHSLQDLEPSYNEPQVQKQTIIEQIVSDVKGNNNNNSYDNYSSNNSADYSGAGYSSNSYNDGFIDGNYSGRSSKLKVIGFKNVTMHAGSTSLIYMLKKMLDGYRKVAAVEVDKVDFLYFNDRDMVSTNSGDLLKEIMKKNAYDIVFVDLNSYEDVDICTEVYYLIEPSTIMINRMMKRNKGILEKLRNSKVILNKCALGSEDIATFEYETKINVLFTIPPVDDRKDNLDIIKKFAKKINL